MLDKRTATQYPAEAISNIGSCVDVAPAAVAVPESTAVDHCTVVVIHRGSVVPRNVVVYVMNIVPLL